MYLEQAEIICMTGGPRRRCAWGCFAQKLTRPRQAATARSPSLLLRASSAEFCLLAERRYLFSFFFFFPFFPSGANPRQPKIWECGKIDRTYKVSIIVIENKAKKTVTLTIMSKCVKVQNFRKPLNK